VSADVGTLAADVGAVVRFVLGACLTLGVFWLVVVRPSSGWRARTRPGDYRREPPDDCPPAVVGLLFAETPGYPGITATLLDLARRDLVRLDGTAGSVEGGRLLFRDDTRLVLTSPSPTSPRFERSLLDFVFGERSEVTVSELRHRWQAEQGEVELWYEGWCSEVAAEAVRRKLWRPAFQTKVARESSERPRVSRSQALGMLLMGATIPAGFALGIPGAFGVMAGAFAVFFLGTRCESPVTEAGARLRDDYAKLRAFLRDFGRLPEQPPEAVVVWDRYLPLALVLGQGQLALETLDITGRATGFPPVDHEPFKPVDIGAIAGRPDTPQRSI
jgi:hypothetical protein